MAAKKKSTDEEVQVLGGAEDNATVGDLTDSEEVTKVRRRRPVIKVETDTSPEPAVEVSGTKRRKVVRDAGIDVSADAVAAVDVSSARRRKVPKPEIAVSGEPVESTEITAVRRRKPAKADVTDPTVSSEAPAATRRRRSTKSDAVDGATDGTPRIDLGGPIEIASPRRRKSTKDAENVADDPLENSKTSQFRRVSLSSDAFQVVSIDSLHATVGQPSTKAPEISVADAVQSAVEEAPVAEVSVEEPAVDETQILPAAPVAAADETQSLPAAPEVPVGETQVLPAENRNATAPIDADALLDAFGMARDSDILSVFGEKDGSSGSPTLFEGVDASVKPVAPSATISVSDSVSSVSRPESQSEAAPTEEVVAPTLRLKRKKGVVRRNDPSLVVSSPSQLNARVGLPNSQALQRQTMDSQILGRINARQQELAEHDPYYRMPDPAKPEERRAFMYFISFGDHDDSRMNIPLSRRHVPRFSRDYLTDRHMRCSGILQNDPGDRPEVLQSPLTPVMLPLHPRMLPKRPAQLARWLANRPARHDLRHILEVRLKWDFIHNWYGVSHTPKGKFEFVQECKAVTEELLPSYSASFQSIDKKLLTRLHLPPLSKLKSDMVRRAAAAEPTQHERHETAPNAEPFVSKTVEGLSQIMRGLHQPTLEEAEPQGEEVDPLLKQTFDYLDTEIEVDDPPVEGRRNYLIDHHITKIAQLFVRWASILHFSDQQVRGGRRNQLFPEYFYARFLEIMSIDEKNARQYGVELPELSIKTRFALDDLDMLLLWFIASDQLEPNLKTALRSTWNQQTVVFINNALFIRLLVPEIASRTEILRRISPSSPMVCNGLLHINARSVAGQPLYFENLISEQLVRIFAGIPSLSMPSTQFAELQFPHFSDDTYISSEHTKTIEILRNFLDRPKLCSLPNLEHENLNFIPSLAFTLEGLPGSGRTTLIKIIASKLGMPVILVQGSPLNNNGDCEDYLKSVFIDVTLNNALLCIRDAGPLLTEEKTASILARLLAIHPIICAFCIDLAVKIHPVVEPYIIYKPKMEANLRDNASILWKQHLALPGLNTHDVDVAALSQRMALQPFQIQKAAKLAYYSTGDLSEAISNTFLEKTSAKQVSKNIGNLAFVTDPEIDLSDVIVSEDIMASIKKIIGSAINRRRVLYEWGLSKRIRRGTGVIALFDGEPGTGKTHSAEAIAHELGLSLMRINIATMVDKYIGETEKNLTTIFEQARPDMQLLLFDEADSLFTKRTANVSKSNDRYSNMSVNVLLQLVERYEGVSVLTTNLKNAIDPAFERRITYKVYFPMPKKKERVRLWRYMCPPEIVTSEPIDYEWLAELEMSGGEIKNAVLTAAFNAATQGKLLNSEFLYEAGVAEASAAGRVMRHYDENNDEFY